MIKEFINKFKAKKIAFESSNVYCNCKKYKDLYDFNNAKVVSCSDAILYYCACKNYRVNSFYRRAPYNGISIFADGYNIKVLFDSDYYYMKKACLDCCTCIGWFNIFGESIKNPWDEVHKKVMDVINYKKGEEDLLKKSKQKELRAMSICNVTDDLDIL